MGKVQLTYIDESKKTPTIEVHFKRKLLTKLEKGDNNFQNIAEDGTLNFKVEDETTKVKVNHENNYVIFIAWDNKNKKIKTEIKEHKAMSNLKIATISIIGIGVSCLLLWCLLNILVGNSTTGASTASIPSDIQGSYVNKWKNGLLYLIDVFVLNDTTVEFTQYYSTTRYEKDSNRGTSTYEVKNLEIGKKDYVEFDLYADDVRYYYCNTSFGQLYCTSKNGNTNTYYKEN